MITYLSPGSMYTCLTWQHFDLWVHFFYIIQKNQLWTHSLVMLSSFRMQLETHEIIMCVQAPIMIVPGTHTHTHTHTDMELVCIRALK